MEIKQIKYTDTFGKYEQFSLHDRVEKILSICNNLDTVNDNLVIFDEIDEQNHKYNKLKDFLEKWSLFEKIYEKLVALELEGKITRDYGKKPISYLMAIIENDGPEYSYIIEFSPTWDNPRIYKVGVCVRGVPLLRRVK